MNTSKSSFTRPLSFTWLSHSHNQSESTTKFYNSSKADAGGHVLTLTWCVLRYDRDESFWMPTDTVKFPVHSVRLRRRKLRHLAGRCYYKCFFLPGVSRVGAIRSCDPSARDPPVCVCLWVMGVGYVCVCVCVCARARMHSCVCVCVRARARECACVCARRRLSECQVVVLVCVSFTLYD